MGKLMAGIAAFMLLFFVAMNTQMICDQTGKWVAEHPKDENAPVLMFWAGWWSSILGDNPNAERMFWGLYKQYPKENDHVAEGLFTIAETRADGASRMSSLDYCKIVIEEYYSVEKWRVKAQKLNEQVTMNVR